MKFPLGRNVPVDWKHVEKYPLRNLNLPEYTAPVDEFFDLFIGSRKYYDQGELNCCVGASSSQMMSIYNKEFYNFSELWNKAKYYDRDPYTNSGDNNGTTVDAAFQVMAKLGLKKFANGKTSYWDLKDGVTSYYWCQSVSDIKKAFLLGRAVVLGINWYEEFMVPKYINKKWWIGTSQNWGQVLGGHAILCNGYYDSNESLTLSNSWGYGYPTVRVHFSVVERLLSEQGECGVVVDKPTN